MVFYFVVLIITTILAYLSEHTRGNEKKLFFAMLVIFPSMISGFRGVATDYLGYRYHFGEIIEGVYDLTDYKSLYVWVIRLLGKAGISWQVIVFGTSLITIYLAFEIMHMYKDEIDFTFAVFSYMAVFYQMSFNIFRQIFAAELFLLATVWLFKAKNKKKFWFYYLLSVLIHSSLLPFGIVFFMQRLICLKKNQWKRVCFYLIVLIGIFSMLIFKEQIGQLRFIISHYGWFITRFQYTGFGFGSLRFLIMAALPALFVSVKNLQDGLNDKGLGYITFYATMGTVIWMTSYVSVSTLYRMSYNFLIALPLMHGMLFKKYRQTLRFMMIMLICVIMFLFWYYDGAVLNTGETVPYRFFWNI